MKSLHPATGSLSSLDLAFCDPSLILDYSWRVNDDLCGGDHFPIILNQVKVSPTQETQRCQLDKAYWDLFEIRCSSELVLEDIMQTENPMECFTNILLSIADQSIPKTSNVQRILRKPWFDDDCKNAISQRKNALGKFERNPCSATLSNLRVYRAKGRRTIRMSKRSSWKTFVSRLNSQTPMKKMRISGKPSPMTFSHLKVNTISNSRLKSPTQ
jgi:hypothetical protein